LHWEIQQNVALIFDYIEFAMSECEKNEQSLEINSKGNRVRQMFVCKIRKFRKLLV